MKIAECTRLNPKEPLCKFFLSWPYPACVALLTVVGYVTGLEFYLNALNMVALCGGILATRSLLPIIPTLSMFIFQISMINSPESHVESSYYKNPVIIGGIVLLFAALFVVSLYTMKKNGILTKTNFKSLPYPIAALVLSVAFLINGAFIPEWGIENMIYGALLIGFYFGLFYFFSLALKNECPEHTLSYLIFTTAMTALVLVAETAHLYLTNDALFMDGTVVKEQVLYGWGMWTMAGQFIAVTIPLCFLGVMKGKHIPLYFITATLALIASVLTLSRNALLIAGATYVIMAVLCCFVGKAKKLFRIITPLGALLVIALMIVFREKLAVMLEDYLNRGLSDNGRFELWEHGINSFISSPIFGKGFFGIQRELTQGCPEGFSFYPRMMHNTPIQLLGSMGIFGFLAYGYYRFETLRPFIKRPTLDKCMLGATLLVIIVGSLIDNFLFLSKHLLFYPIVLAVAFKLAESEGDNGTL